MKWPTRCIRRADVALKATNVKLRTTAARFVAAAAASSLLSAGDRNHIDHLLLIAHKERAAS